MASKGIGLREWSISAEDFPSEDEFRQAIASELASFEHIGHRLGVGVVAVPVRRRVGQDWDTAAWVFRPATVPAAREGEPDLAVVTDAETVPVDGPPEAAAA